MWATVKHQYYIVADLPQRWAALCHRLIPGGWDWGKGKDGMCSDTHTHTHACAGAQTCTHCHWSGSSDRCKTMQCKNKTKAETESEALYAMERERERVSLSKILTLASMEALRGKWEFSAIPFFYYLNIFYFMCETEFFVCQAMTQQQWMNAMK